MSPQRASTYRSRQTRGPTQWRSRHRVFRHLPPSVWKERKVKRGYRGLYERSVNQAEEGADFDFLTAAGPKHEDYCQAFTFFNIEHANTGIVLSGALKTSR
jgi:hypothetical protein